MAKADVLDLVTVFALGQEDAARVSDDYDELVRLLAYVQPWSLSAALITPTPGTSEYTMPDEAARIIALFYGGRQLSRESKTTLESYNQHWRDEKGHPISYIVEDQSALTFRLYPTPNVLPEDHIPGTTTFGASFPDRNITAIMVEKRGALPVWTDEALALELVFREFMRDTRHRNSTFAAQAGKMAAALTRLVA